MKLHSCIVCNSIAIKRTIAKYISSFLQIISQLSSIMPSHYQSILLFGGDPKVQDEQKKILCIKRMYCLTEPSYVLVEKF